MKRAIAISLIGLLFAVSWGLEITDCGSDFDIFFVGISGCQATPCDFTPGMDYNVTINVRTNAAINTLTTNASFVYRGYHNAINVTPVSPCEQWGCPLKEISTLDYEAKISIPSDTFVPYPGFIEWRTYLPPPGRFAICFQVESVTAYNETYRRILSDIDN